VQLEAAADRIAALERDGPIGANNWAKAPSTPSPNFQSSANRSPANHGYHQPQRSAEHLRSLLCQAEGNLRHGLVLGRRQVRVGGRRPNSFKGVAGTE